MGNCLVIQDRKEMRIVSVDDVSSEVLKVPPCSRLMKVHDDSLGEPQPLPAASVLPVNAPAGTVRVKLVISKRELKMLDKEGVSLDDVVSLMRKEASDSEQEEGYCCGGWRPALESIPEGSDL